MNENASRPIKSKRRTRHEFLPGDRVRRRENPLNPVSIPYPIGVVAGEPREKGRGIWYIPVRFEHRTEYIHIGRLEHLDA